MSKLYRFSTDGRFQGEIIIDRPAEQYASRTDLTSVAPPAAQAGFWRKWQNGVWGQVLDVPPVVPLETAKIQRWIEMKSQRKLAIEAPLVTPYGTFDVDETARNNIAQTTQFIQTEAQTLAPATEPTVEFTLADNSVVILTAQQMVEVALLLAAQVQAAYARGRDVRAAIYAASAVEEVAAIQWEQP